MTQQTKRYLLIMGILTTAILACGTLGIGIVQTPTPVDPASLPLSLESDSETIRMKLLNSHKFWETIFVNGIVTWYAPEGSDLPSQTYFQQIWIAQENHQFRYINGTSEIEPDLFKVSDGQNILEWDLVTGSSQKMSLPNFAREPFNPPTALSDTVYPHPLEGIIGSPFMSWIFPAGIAQTRGTYVPIRMDSIAGRETLMVDWYFDIAEQHNRTLWVDVEMGVVLKVLDYGKGGGSDTLQSEYVIAQVIYDTQFDSELFDLTPSSLPQFSDVYGVSLHPDGPAPTPSSEPDPLGYLYFFVFDHAASVSRIKLVKLPGSCVTGAIPCPNPIPVEFPFDWPFGISSNQWAWSPDGELAVFPYPNREDGNWASLNIYDPELETWISIVEFAFIDSVRWSPDGNWISFRVQDGYGSVDIYAVQPDGSNLKNITSTENLPEDGQPYIMNGWVGDKLIVHSGNPGSKGLVYAVGVESGEVNKLSESLQLTAYLHPSPDGSLVAFSKYDSISRKHTIKVTTWDGENVQELGTFQSSIFPIIWSPDGNFLAFSVYGMAPEMSADVYIINKDGTNLKHLIHSETFANFIFSPDGNFLVVEEGIKDKLYIVNLSTLESHLLSAPDLDLNKSWRNVSWRP